MRLIEQLKVRLALPLIREGAAAPLFFLPDAEGATRGLDGWVLLVFHGSDATYAARVAERAPALAAVGCTPYAIGRRRAALVGLPTLQDDGTVARAYGAWVDLPALGGRIVPSVVLVNPARKVRLANRGTPSIDAIVRTIQALQQATRAGM